MAGYWAAVWRRAWSAAFDVLFVAAISLAPLIFGRMVLVLGPPHSVEPYWAFLTNGQLAFYSMGSLATLLVLCFRKGLPDSANILIGGFAVFCLLFLMVLVGVDPTLKAGAYSWVGSATLYLYVAVLIIRIVADAIKSVDAPDALEAGREAVSRTTAELKERMAGR